MRIIHEACCSINKNILPCNCAYQIVSDSFSSIEKERPALIATVFASGNVQITGVPSIWAWKALLKEVQSNLLPDKS